MHFSKRHKLTIVIHREQKIFNVAIISFRNSSTYVQKQINRILRFNQTFAKIYIDDIVIFSKTLNDYLMHLRDVFEIFKINNILIKSFKSFIEYSSITLLKKHVNSFDLITDEQKFKQ